ncbi:MAG: DUF4238 domain-containing protein [Actinomycetales bacterium]|nr:DUF4238 domain-containing protein [Actinomycetales bacterium]
MSPHQPVRNHTVNRSHLARFARDGILHRLTLGEHEVSQPVPISFNDASVHKYFYVAEDPEGNRDYRFEAWAADFEGAATTAIRDILDGTPWSAGDAIKRPLAEWIALQEARTPLMRHRATNLVRVLLHQFQQDGAAERLEAFMAAAGWEFNERERELLREQIKTYRAEEGRVTPGMHIDLIRASMADAVPTLLARGWVLVRFDNESLFTSDNPVVMLGDQFLPSPMRLGLTDAQYVSVAVDRKAALALPLDPGDGELQGTREMAHAINAATYMNADEVLFMHPDDDAAAMLPSMLPPRTRFEPSVEDFKDFSEWPIAGLQRLASIRKQAAEQP